MKQKIDLLDLKAQSRIIKSSLMRRIEESIDNCDFISGAAVAEIESALSDYTCSQNVISCGNGTDALQVALMSLGADEGYVICPSFSFVATAEIIPLLGLKPHFVDIELDSFNIDPASVEAAAQKITSSGKKIVAIISVDLFGRPCNYNEISRIANKFNTLHISDCAQSFGANYFDSSVLNIADISTTSFFPTKPLGCYGDGGAIFTNNDSLAETMRSICVHGKGEHKYDNIRLGINSRLDTIQAKVLLEKIKILENEIILRNKVAKIYSNNIQRKDMLPTFVEKGRSAWAQFTLRLKSEKERGEFRDYLLNHGIPTGVYYPKIISEQSIYSNYPSESILNSQKCAKTVVSLPMSPYLPTDTQTEICRLINEF